jgi:hypothetical protein
MSSLTGGVTQVGVPVEPTKKAPPSSRNVGFTMNSLKSLETSKMVKVSTFAQSVV